MLYSLHNMNSCYLNIYLTFPICQTLCEALYINYLIYSSKEPCERGIIILISYMMKLKPRGERPCPVLQWTLHVLEVGLGTRSVCLQSPAPAPHPLATLQCCLQSHALLPSTHHQFHSSCNWRLDMCSVFNESVCLFPCVSASLFLDKEFAKTRNMWSVVLQYISSGAVKRALNLVHHDLRANSWLHFLAPNIGEATLDESLPLFYK